MWRSGARQTGSIWVMVDRPIARVAAFPNGRTRTVAWATGTLAKTDTLDAGVLAHFADAVRPDVRPLKDAETQVLNSLGLPAGTR